MELIKEPICTHDIGKIVSAIALPNNRNLENLQKVVFDYQHLKIAMVNK